MDIRKTRAAAWVFVVGWMAVIFVLSGTPNLRSGFDATWDTILRKIAHGVEYGILGWLVIRAVRHGGASRFSLIRTTLFICMVYAASDEWHQTFVHGRHGAVLDATIDVVGSFIGALWNIRRVKDLQT